MKHLVTVTCNRDFQHMLLQAESIQKFVGPCTHWIVINEYENLDIQHWHNALNKFYTHHQYKILTPNDFSVKSITHREWHSQQFFKLAVSKLINEDYLILDTKSFFIRPTNLDEWDDTIGSGTLNKFGESIEGPSWEDISTHYATKLNVSPLTHFVFNVPFKVKADVLKTYDLNKLADDLYPSEEEQKNYFNLKGKQLFPSEFILYSYLVRDYFDYYKSIPRSFVYVVPAHIRNKNNAEILVEIMRKTISADRDENITTFAFHPLIFESLSKTHIEYVNSWISKMNFKFQFDLPNNMYDINMVSKLHIELSSRCNASCPVCSRNISGGIVSPGLELTELSINDIKRIIPIEMAKNITYINYCGTVGDPCMAPDLLPILKYFKESSPNVIQYIRTNGGMRNVEFWTELGNFFSRSTSNQNFGNVVFSVDGLEDTNHIYRRGVKWEKLISHMKAYSATGATATWEWLIFEHNQHQLEEAKALARELNFKFVVKNPLGFEKNGDKVIGIPVYNKDGDFEYSIWPANYSNIKEGPVLGNKVNFAKMDTMNIIPIIDESSRQLEQNSNIRCKSLPLNSQQEVYISANKYMLPCCFMGGMFGQFGASYPRYQFNKMIKEYGLDVFNLEKQSIPDILSNPKFSKFFFDGWKADTIENGKLLYCVENCGDKSAIDKIYSNSPKSL